MVMWVVHGSVPSMISARRPSAADRFVILVALQFADR